MRRIAIYLRPGELGDARAAYLADWRAVGLDDSLRSWVERQVAAYAALEPAQRAGARRPAAEGDRVPRTFDVDEDVIAAAYAAMHADQVAHGTWDSASTWFGDALAYAVRRARDRDGELPTPPARLPPRMSAAYRAPSVTP